MDRLDLFEGITGCRNRCSGITIDEHTNVPRGYFTLAQPGDPIDLILVAQNPGQPMDVERRAYRGSDPRFKAKTHLARAREFFLLGSGKKFHNRLNQWMCDLYRLPLEEVYRRVVYTNVVKCTTTRNALPPTEVVKACISLHLRREILIWRPKVVVALGSAASGFLNKANIMHMILPHPSHRGKDNNHCRALKNIYSVLNTNKHNAT